jgi:putative FmdB family regulatory protein
MLYVYKCEGCGFEDEVVRSVEDRDKDLLCEKCNHSMKRVMRFTTNRDWFRAHWNEDLDHEPIFVESKQHYKRLCKERGVFARCLL